MTPAWQMALRRGSVALVLGVLCLVASWPVTGDLDPLLKGLGVILVVLGMVIVLATGRTLSADDGADPDPDPARPGQFRATRRARPARSPERGAGPRPRRG